MFSVGNGDTIEALIPLIIQAISGAAGSGIVGNLIKTVGMKFVAKLILGAIGGVAGGSIASGAGPLDGLLGGLMAGDARSGMDMGGILTQVAGGAFGGGALTGIGGILANMMKKS